MNMSFCQAFVKVPQRVNAKTDKVEAQMEGEVSDNFQATSRDDNPRML
jgi:hypothetical protein